MPRNVTDSSDDEDDKLRRQQMREAVAENDLSNAMASPSPPTPVQLTLNNIAQPLPPTSAASGVANTAATATPNTNPFYTLLMPPVPAFFSMVPKPVDERLKRNPIRSAFLQRIEAQIAAQRSTLERRRRAAGLHGLMSRRVGGDDDVATGPRILNSFEKSMLRNLETMVAKNLEFVDHLWPDDTPAQRAEREKFDQAKRQFVVLKRFPPGSFLDEQPLAFGGGEAKTASASASTAVSTTEAPSTETDEERKRRKAEKKQRKLAAAAAASATGKNPDSNSTDVHMTDVTSTLPVETEEQRRIRKAAKKERKRKQAEEQAKAAEKENSKRQKL